MERTLPNIIGAIMTGLLTLLWTDLRKIRTERESLMDMIRSNAEEIDEKYMSMERHELICSNAALRMEQTVGKMLKEAVHELKEEIRKNGNGK